METTLEVVELVRRYKSESQISMGAELSKIIISCSSGERSAIEQFSDDLLGVTKAKNIEWIILDPSDKESKFGVACVLP